MTVASPERMPRIRSFVFCSALGVSIAAAASCRGSIGDAPFSPRGSRTSPPGGPAIPAGYSPGDVIPVEASMRRLTNAEYDRTLSDLFGVAGSTSERFAFAPDDLVGGFENSLSGLIVTTRRVRDWQRAAEAVAQETLANADRRLALAGCDLAAAPSCVEAFVRAQGSRIYRRPLADEEVARLLALASAAGAATGVAAAQIALEAMLQSPHFLFRIDVGQVDEGSPSPRRKLDGYELATRLAYALWGTTPDDALLAAARAGELDSAEGVRASVRRMLEDERARVGARAFTDGWLRLLEIARDMGPAEASSSVEEIRRVVDEHSRGSARDLLGILTTPAAWIDADLADVYGASAPPSEPWARVELPPELERDGILSRAAFLRWTAHGGEFVAVPRRGVLVREMLLCADVLTLPSGLDLPTPDPTQTVRAFWEPVESEAPCSGCHGVLNPIGHGFERYAPDGRRRDVGRLGEMLTGEGAIALSLDAPEQDGFHGVVELGRLLAQRADVERCVVEHLHVYLHGRAAAPRDGGEIERARAAFHDGGRIFDELLVDFTSSDAFRYVSEPVPIPEGTVLGTIDWSEEAP